MSLLSPLEGLHSAETFHPDFLEAFLQRVREVEARPREYLEALRGRLVATVFHEPSTRTRLSFEAAAQRLGAGILTVADPATTSARKGESLADTARMVGSYADLVVWRHPWEGATRLAALHAGVPVVNGGDGRLGHPTQTLVDLYVLWKEWGGIAGRTVGLLGDLLHGRTARSLAWGLVRSGARLVLLPGPGLEWEDAFEERLLEQGDYRLRLVRHALVQAWTGREVARILEPRTPVQGTLFADERPVLERLDALYLTRLQEERGARADRAYPGLRPEQLGDPVLRGCLFLHPLPRRSELPVEVDRDPRVRYFAQAAAGPPVRMTLFLAMLRPDLVDLPALDPLPAGQEDPALGSCANENCVSRGEGLSARWRITGRPRRMFLCAWCDQPLKVDYVGCRSTRRFHPAHSPALQRIRPENLRPFRDRESAEAAGFSWAGA